MPPPDNLNRLPGVACDDRSQAHGVDAADAPLEVWFTDIAARMAALFAETPPWWGPWRGSTVVSARAGAVPGRALW